MAGARPFVVEGDGVAEDTQHQALYRRYRPQTPSELLGQEHVVRALTGACARAACTTRSCSAGRGGRARPPPRGSWPRWSTASTGRRRSRAASAPSASRSATARTSTSSRSTRPRTAVSTTPATCARRRPPRRWSGREKIYIIDEAQRLSREAFDALLKLFEEPPPGVRFVLATTEPHKMPATIVGRCQRFDFRRLTHRRARRAAAERSPSSEGVQLDPARRAARSRGRPRGRPATRCRCSTRRACWAGERVDEDVVRSLLGAPQGEIRVEIADVVAVGDLRGAFEAVDRLVQAGHDLRNVTGRSARALPEPAGRAGRARPGRPARRPGRRLRGAAGAGRQVHAGRALARARAAARGADRHALDHVAAAHPRAGARARLRRRRPTRRPRAWSRASSGWSASPTSPPAPSRPRRTPSRSRWPSPHRRREPSSKKAASEAGDGLGRRGGSRRRSGPRGSGRRGRHPAPGSACGRRGERRRRDAPPVVGIADPAPRPAQAGGPARAHGERDADVVRRHDARARVPADVQEHGQAGGEPRGSVPGGPAGAVRDLAGDLVRRARVARRRRRDRTSSRSRKTTRPPTTQRRCVGSRRCSAPSP